MYKREAFGRAIAVKSISSDGLIPVESWTEKRKYRNGFNFQPFSPCKIVIVWGTILHLRNVLWGLYNNVKFFFENEALKEIKVVLAIWAYGVTEGTLEERFLYGDVLS